MPLHFHLLQILARLLHALATEAPLTAKTIKKARNLSLEVNHNHTLKMFI